MHFWNAVGPECPHPDWWGSGQGAWGCYQSHLGIIQHCLASRIDEVLILEDDAMFCKDFFERIDAFIEATPKIDSMIYLGGQLKFAEGMHQPRKVNELVLNPYNVHRTHAYVIRGRSMMQNLYRFLNATPFQNHIDHHYGRFHMRQWAKRLSNIFCPHQWLVGQYASSSDIHNNLTGNTYFDQPRNYTGS